MSRSSLHGICMFKVWYGWFVYCGYKLSGAGAGKLKLREHIITHKGMSSNNNILHNNVIIISRVCMATPVYARLIMKLH